MERLTVRLITDIIISGVLYDEPDHSIDARRSPYVHEYYRR